MGLILKLIVSALAVLAADWLLPGVSVNSMTTAILVAIVLALLNTFVKPVLVFLTIPITVLTLGLFLLVINAIMVLIAEAVVPGMRVDGFLSAVLFSLVVSVLTALMEWLGKDR